MQQKAPDKHNVSADTSISALIRNKTMFNPKPKQKMIEESKKDAFDITKDKFFDKQRVDSELNPLKLSELFSTEFSTLSSYN